MILGENYLPEFKKTYANHLNDEILNLFIRQEKEIGDFSNWTKNDIIDLFKQCDTININAVANSYNLLKNFIKYVSDKKNISYNSEITEMHSYDLINIDNFVSTVLSPIQVNYLISKINRNVRDKVVLELAWNCLEPNEIIDLKTSDIEFLQDEFGLDYVHLKLSDDKFIDISDTEIIKHIKQCMKCFEYYVECSNGASKRFKFKDSDYLIKPTVAGKPNKNDDGRFTQIGTMLKNVIKSLDIKIEGVDMENVTLENIRRSKIIYLLSPVNLRNGYSSREYVANILGNKNADSPTMKFFEEMASIIYSD